jgi:hypothetical protein
MTMTFVGSFVLVLMLVFDTPREAWGEMKMDNEEVGPKIIVLGASYAGGWDRSRPIAGYRMVTKGVDTVSGGWGSCRWKPTTSDEAMAHV